jgi:hypothetical protein
MSDISTDVAGDDLQPPAEFDAAELGVSDKTALSDISTDIAAPTKRRGPPPRRRIDLPNGDYLEPRAKFAVQELGVSDKSALSDIGTDIAATKRRGRQPRRRIDLPNGDYLQPRAEFAAAELGVSDKTARRLNLPTTYMGNIAYVLHDASLTIVAAGVQRRNQPARLRRRA